VTLGFLAGRLPRDWIRAVEALGCASVHLDQKRLGPRAVAAVKGAGLKLLAYTVNDLGRARDLLDSGVDAVFTDLPDRLLAAVGD
jgi:glycerophosphoryl diester phosphodiesterase